MWRWVFAGLAALVLVGGVVAAVRWDDGDWKRHDGGVTRVVAEDGTETIVVRDGPPGGFFPFGFFFFALVLLFGFLAVRAFAGRGRWGGGPWMAGGAPAADPPPWFEDWHRRTHEGGTIPPAAGTPPAGS